MGVSISKSAELSPLSIASIAIGFISFAFTVSTFLKVVWANLSTLNEAPHEVHSTLTDLRVELLEEKRSLKRIRRWIRKRDNRYDQSDEAMDLDRLSLKTMEDMVRNLIKRFKEVEAPFLEAGEVGIGETSRRRRSSTLPRYAHSMYGDVPEKRDTGHDQEDDDPYWALRQSYASYSIGKRLAWLRKKSDAEDLRSALSRVQIRRIALQVGGMSVRLHRHEHDTWDLDEIRKDTSHTRETVRRVSSIMDQMNERMNRIVGVRRIDEHGH